MQNSIDNLSILIVNSNLPSRTRLREVIKSFLFKGEIHNAQNLREASDKIKTIKEIDAVFVSSEFPKEDLASFVRSLSINEKGECKQSLILTLKSQERDAATKVTSLFMEGFHGFVAEPYSTDDVSRLVGIIQENKAKQDAAIRHKKATAFLAQDAIKHIDDLAKLKESGTKGTGTSLIDLKAVSQSLKKLQEQNSEEFYTILIDTFEKVPAPVKAKVEAKKKRAIEQTSHPSAAVREIMTQRNLSMDRLKGLIRMDFAEFEEFLLGKRSIDDFLSRELARVFGKTAREWSKMQKAYDVFLEKLAAEAAEEGGGSEESSES